jgi:hypothetical protein
MAPATKKRKNSATTKTAAKKKPVKSAVALRVQKHREMMRAAGYKPVTRWVPDASDPIFAAECRRQAKSLANDPAETEILDWLDKARDIEGWV